MLQTLYGLTKYEKWLKAYIECLVGSADYLIDFSSGWRVRDFTKYDWLELSINVITDLSSSTESSAEHTLTFTCMLIFLITTILRRNCQKKSNYLTYCKNDRLWLQHLQSSEHLVCWIMKTAVHKNTSDMRLVWCQNPSPNAITLTGDSQSQIHRF